VDRLAEHRDDVPAAFQELLERMMSKDPADRPADDELRIEQLAAFKDENVGRAPGRLAGELGGIFGETFSGLWKAISAGDWEGAGQVAMAGLKAAWLSGSAALQQICNDLKAAMIEAFAGMVIAVQRMWSDLLNKINNKIIEWSTEEGAIGAAARAVLGTDLRGMLRQSERGRRVQRPGAVRG
jgi:hypothetical protein